MARNRLRYVIALAVIGVLGLATEARLRATDRRANQELDCLAANVYHEARGEPLAGQLAVSDVVLNRVADSRWPDTICAVVWQPHQFSWTGDQLSDELTDPAARETAYRMAAAALHIQERWKVTHYHAAHIRPDWASSLTEVARIGNHVFYK